MAILAAIITKVGRSGQYVLATFLGFLRRPCVRASEAAVPVPKPILLLWLLAFAFGVTAMFGLLALPLIVVSEVAVGENLKQVLDRSALSVLVALIVLGPLVEEIIFRGWLTGTYQAMGGAALFLGIFYGAATVLEGTGSETVRLVAQLGVSSLAFLVFVVIERSGTPTRPGGYEALFPYLFWLQGLTFGALHFANLAGSSIALPFLMAAPLVICGWLFAYARVVAGFGSAWLLHALYNIPPAAGAILLPLLSR